MVSDDIAIDVHQHLWPPTFVDVLRSRTKPPRLREWTLHLDGEPPYDVDPVHHDIAVRAARERADGAGLAMVSLSSPLGVEWLDSEDADLLLDAWHEGAASLPPPFRAWASAAVRDPDPGPLRYVFERGFLGLQIPANALASPDAIERLGPLLAVCEAQDRPVFVHPGTAARPSGAVPPWWPAVVDYVGQQQAAWWAWHVAGRASFPRLRICFAAAAGLAPLQHERLAARGGPHITSAPRVYVETSSYAADAIQAVVRVLGAEAVVFGTNHPYAEPADPALDGAVTKAIRTDNPHQLLFGSTP